MKIFRLYVEKKSGFNTLALKLKADIKNLLGINIKELRAFIRYDIQDITEEDYQKAKNVVFSEPPCDNVFEEEIILSSY